VRKFVRVLVLSLLILGMTGCASIVSKSDYPVTISSIPEGASVVVTNSVGTVVYTGKTPSTVLLTAGSGYFRGQTYKVQFEFEGFQPTQATIERSLDGWYMGNILFGGLIGMIIVDPSTGAMWRLHDLHVELQPSYAGQFEEGLHILTLEQVPDELRSSLVRIN
jgi:hypothetical protein